MRITSNRLLPALIAAPLAVGAACSTSAAVRTPDVASPRAEVPSADEARIEAQRICVGSTAYSAGDLGRALFYRSARLSDGKLLVGYYAFFSEERPWGNNWQTWLFFPALVTDLVYTRTLLVAPGVQRLAYGKGDVEGFRILYADEGGALRPEYAVADDASHTEHCLSPAQLFAVDPSRPTLYTTGWSHQLAGVGARSQRELAYERCYGPEEIRPLTAQIVREFRLDRRARPAWVGAMPAAPPLPAVAGEPVDRAASVVR